MKNYKERTDAINKKVKRKRRQRAVIITSVTTACVLLVLTVVCSLPILGQDVPSINAYRGDEYYPLISKINEQYQYNKYSVFSQISTSVGGIFEDAASPAPGETTAAPSDNNYITDSEGNNGNSSSDNKYEETTLNQVDGVTEGDILKRSTNHAFYLKNYYSQNALPCYSVSAYLLDGNNTAKVCEYVISARDGTHFTNYDSFLAAEMFLNADATRLTVIAPCLSEQSVVYTAIVSLDVSDVESIAEVNRVYVSGRYVSSRLIDGKLLVITNFTAGNYGYYGHGKIDYDNKATYVPQCGGELESDFIAMEDIYIPDKCRNINYTVLALLDEDTLSIEDNQAVFSYVDDVYVSQNYIVIARNSRYYYLDACEYGNEVELNKAESSKNAKQTAVCEIVALSYGDGIKIIGATGVEGLLKDRYSMDEKDGILRMFTTTRYKYSPFVWEVQESLNVSLYCVDLESMNVVASKERFAPIGDEVKSARFDGNAAYVCTARGTIDPVFVFDLSDLNNITYKDTGEIAGFSNNLIVFGDLLLGIGQGEARGSLKIELYKESHDTSAENGVESVCAYERNCMFSVEYKAHFVNVEQGLIGLHIYDYGDDVVTINPNGSRNKYLLLRFNGNNLEQIYLEPFDCASDLARAFYDDNGAYVFGSGNDEFAFVDLTQI